MTIRAGMAVVGASLVVAGPAQAAKPCTFRGARTIVQNAKVRVYKQLSKDHFLMKYYGCVKRTNRTFKLDLVTAEQGYAFDFRLSGFVVGYAMYYSDEGSNGYGYVASWNVKKRKLIRKADATTNTDGSYGVDRLLMTPTGALTWVGSYGDEPPSLVYEVHVFDGAGNRVADSGPDIDKKSLALDGHSVTWKRAGQTKSATIGA